ncbi:hypothetical protein FJQ98_18585 [Lysinibacillus agricola]|uniref:Uncharacterized protein n=1 Tax=Lysinibacillus agricola TaxID=2590012 RepID=A0ABX7AN61_9BACI|nr:MULTISPECIES: hypothetical protein [Lysinibacillus]KOS61806.1 hypothetical protein AN161_16030 [Lysinibacillus sp. FJAT-14222]QQP11211.1 hypothetical protein FJQ98_18585 [Lysinibacillus agricola]
MENLEIILEDFRKDELNKLVFEELLISSPEVKSSHFFDKNSGDNIEFHQIKSYQEILTPLGTGNVFLNQIEIGCSLNNVMIIFSFDKDTGDITFNFSERELLVGARTEIKLKSKKIVESLLVLKDKYDIPKIRIGFEPASDEDSCLLVIGQEAIDLESAIEQILR